MTTTSTSPDGGLREELRSDAESLSTTAKQRLQREVDSRKGVAVDQARSLSSALGSAASQLGPDQPSWLRSALEQGSQTIQRFAETVEQKDARQLSEEVRRLANQSPGTFLAGCALAGFAAARVFKAGGESAANGSTGSGQTSQFGQGSDFGQDSGLGQASQFSQTSDLGSNSPGSFSSQSGQSGQSSQAGSWGQTTGTSTQGTSSDDRSAFFTANEEELTKGRAGDGL